MKKIITIFLVAFLSFQNFTGIAQIDTVFWFATPFVSPDNTPRDNYILHVYTYGTAATVRLRQPAAIAPNKYDTIFTLPANSEFDYIFWRDKLASPTNRGFDSLEVQPSDAVLPYGLYISASASISAVFDIATRSPFFGNPETFSLKGQNGLGLEFLCPFQTKANNQTLTDLAGTQPGIIQPKQQINIVASKPNTTIWITPKCNIIGHLANVTYSIMLPFPGSAYTIENAVQTTTVAGNNLSGTSITSDKLISVTVADDSAKSLSGCYDLGGDQVIPVNVTGKEYVIVKGLFNPAENEGAYIVGTVNTTQITIDDGVVTTTVINKGDTYFYKTNQQLTSIIADKDVYVLQLTGFGCEMGQGLVPPLSCAGSSIAPFTRSSPQQFFLNLYCKTGIEGGFTLNNAASSVTIPITTSQFTVIPGTSALPGGPYLGTRLSLNSATLLPLGSYTVANSLGDFGMSVCSGGATTGSNYHFMTLFMKKTTVSTNTVGPICVGSNNTISLSGSITGASSTGTWTTANGTGIFGTYSSTINTIATTYTLSNADTLLSNIKFYLTSTGSCKPLADSITIQIIQRPQVFTANGATLCASANSIALTGTITNATSGAWSGGTGFIPPGINITYSPTAADIAAGTLTMTLTSVGGCTTVTKSITFTFVPLPTITANTSNSLICDGQSVTLTAGGANIYLWNTTSTNTSIVVSPTVTTVYTVTGTTNGCSNSATLTQNVSPCTGIDKLNSINESSLTVFPNPNSGEFIIKVESDARLLLLNELGQQLKTIVLNDGNDHRASVTGLANGIYFISGKINNKAINQKIIVAK